MDDVTRKPESPLSGINNINNKAGWRCAFNPKGFGSTECKRLSGIIANIATCEAHQYICNSASRCCVICARQGGEHEMVWQAGESVCEFHRKNPNERRVRLGETETKGNKTFDEDSLIRRPKVRRRPRYLIESPPLPVIRPDGFIPGHGYFPDGSQQQSHPPLSPVPYTVPTKPADDIPAPEEVVLKEESPSQQPQLLLVELIEETKSETAVLPEELTPEIPSEVTTREVETADKTIVSSVADSAAKLAVLKGQLDLRVWHMFEEKKITLAVAKQIARFARELQYKTAKKAVKEKLRAKDL